MKALFPVIAIVLFVLYSKECRKNKKMVRDYQDINARLFEIASEDEINYILVPTDRKAVKETAQGINYLLEKFYKRQIEYNRSQKAVLQIVTNISHDLRTPIICKARRKNSPLPCVGQSKKCRAIHRKLSAP